jgi:hypothetical protein
MSDSIHALIQTFLQQHTAMSLHGKPQEGVYTKAGVIPFLRQDDGFSYYVMRPQTKMPELGEPPFQLCKGTRMHHVETLGWRDVKEPIAPDAKLETLVATALREGVEELGLKLDNILQLFDVGPYGFSSATTGKSKTMWLFAAEVGNSANFLSASEIASSTADRSWMRVSEFDVVGREDHRYILTSIDAKLAAAFNA